MGMLSDKVVLSKWRKEKGWREERRKEREDMEIKEKHWHVFYKQTTVKKGNKRKVSVVVMGAMGLHNSSTLPVRL